VSPPGRIATHYRLAGAGTVVAMLRLPPQGEKAVDQGEPRPDSSSVVACE